MAPHPTPRMTLAAALLALGLALVPGAATAQDEVFIRTAPPDDVSTRLLAQAEADAASARAALDALTFTTVTTDALRAQARAAALAPPFDPFGLAPLRTSVGNGIQDPVLVAGRAQTAAARADLEALTALTFATPAFLVGIPDGARPRAVDAALPARITPPDPLVSLFPSLAADDVTSRFLDTRNLLVSPEDLVFPDAGRRAETVVIPP